MQSVHDLKKIEARLQQRLFEMRVPFRGDGLPEFPSNHLLLTLPGKVEMLPFSKRHAARDPAKTILASFSRDDDILVRLDFIDGDLEEYRRFLGFSGFDVSPRGGMSPQEQWRVIRVNAMANTYLALKGDVKMLPNFRIGGIGTLASLSLYPQGCAYAVGTLGCARGNVAYNRAYLKVKLAYTRPSFLLIYGSVVLPEYRAVLDGAGIACRFVKDYRTRSYAGEL